VKADFILPHYCDLHLLVNQFVLLGEMKTNLLMQHNRCGNECKFWCHS